MSKKVIIVGASNIDIVAISKDEVNLKDSNPGKIKISNGGVGRNIAENISRLHDDIGLISVLGDDNNGLSLAKHARGRKIDLSHSLVENGKVNDTYMAIMNNCGSHVVSIAAMELISKIDKNFISERLDYLKTAKLVVIDANISSEVAKYIIQNIDAEVILDGVSGTKVMKHKEILHLFDYVKLNEQEANAIFKLNIKCLADVKKHKKTIESFGIKKLIITLGAEGVVFIVNDQLTHIQAYKSKLVNTLGCGDSFIGGMVYGLANNFPLETSVKYGLACSAITLSVKTTTTKLITKENVEKILKEEKWT